MAAVLRKYRTPLGEPRPRLCFALEPHDALPLHEAGCPRDLGTTGLRAKDARHVIEIVSSVERDALGFRDANAGRIPRLVLELEDRAHGTVGDDPLALEVPRAIQRVVLPDRRAPGAKRLADVEEIGAFASIVVILVMTFRIPLL